MIFIPPLEIASKIMTLIQDADKEVIIVSPYVDLSKWDKMKKCLEKALQKGIKITFIARRNAKQDLSVLSNIGITPILIDDLHAKVYINDSYAIVTSLNLIQYSDTNSIDIAYRTDTKPERKELLDFVDKYVVNLKKTAPPTPTRITQNLSEKTLVFKEYQTNKIYDAFVDKFWETKFNKTSAYVFGEKLFPFGDAMIDSRLSIRIQKSRTDFNEIIKYIETLQFKSFHEFKIELNLKSRSTLYYLEFVPTRAIEIQKLAEDYVNVCRTILNSEIHRVLKRQAVFW